ncbi:S-layer homology domain-containing protein [Paenibacillus lemnae]|uniref:SLH domain-containing protein n=1 Tax=Paenibacillus lemnae TaxID=1330551 RepID=A0A848M731_PAELE|nr:S-layer homology domain-containing protein [Paenibacillus lemnae]NMO96000.1 hypothetical protein [Paenibacillus lemnae]
MRRTSFSKAVSVMIITALLLTMAPWPFQGGQIYGDAQSQIVPINIVNGDFEGEIVNGRPEGWKYWSGGTASGMSVSESVYQSGNRSIALNVDKKNVGAESTPFAVQEGEILNVTASVYVDEFSTTNANGGVEMWVRYFKSDQIVESNRILKDTRFKIPADEVVTGQWTQLGGDTLPVPAEAKYAIVFLYVHKDNIFSGYYDDIQAVKYVTNEEEEGSPLNAGFEQPVIGGNIQGWTVSPNPANENAGAVISQEQAAGGSSSSLKITDNNNSRAVTAYSDYMDVAAGKTYAASTDLYIAEGSGRIYIKFYDTANREVGSISQGAESPLGEWNRVRVEGKAPEGAVKARILLYSGLTSVNVEAYYDNVVFEEATVLTMPTEFGQPVSLGDATVVAKTNGGAIGSGEIYFGASGAPAQFYVLDAVTGSVKFTAPIPTTDVIWAVTVGSDGNAYLAGTKTGIMYRYNRAEQKLESLGENPSNKWIWDLDASSDGKIYGSTYPDSKAFVYDIETGEYFDYGTLKPGQEYVRGSGVTDKYFYAGITTIGHLIRIDRETGEKVEIKTPITGIRAGISSIVVYDKKMYLTHGTSLLIMNEEDDKTEYSTVKRLLYEDDDASDGKISPPSPYNSELMYYRNQHTSELWTYNRETNETAPVMPKVSLPDKQLITMNWVELTEGPDAGRQVLSILNNEVDHMVFDPQTHTLDINQPDVEKSGIEINSMELGPDGKFYMGGYQGAMSIYDNNKGYFERQEKEPHQISSTGFLNNKVYFGLYGGAVIWRYDLSQPYNLGVNPGFFHDIPNMQSRTMTFTSGDDHLFVGSVADYGQLAGALTVYNEPADQWNTYQDVVKNQSVIGLAYKEGKVYGGTSIWGGLGIDITETEAKLFEWDVASATKTAELIPNVPGFSPKMIGELSIGPDGNLYGIMWGESPQSSNSSALFVMDPETKEVLRYEILTTGQKASDWRPFFLYWGPDGLLYTTIGRQLIVFDPETLAYNKLIDADVHVMALGPDGSVYYKNGAQLMRLPVRMTGASISPESASVEVGKSIELPVTLQLMNGLTGNADGTEITYHVSDPLMASIEDGVLQGLKEGTVSIYASVVQDSAVVSTDPVTVTVTAAEDPEEEEPSTPNPPVTNPPVSTPVNPQNPSLPGAGTPVGQGEQEVSAAELRPNSNSAGGSVTIKLEAGKTAAVLPNQADEWLGEHDLNVVFEQGSISIPVSVLKALKMLDPQNTNAQLVISMEEVQTSIPAPGGNEYKPASPVLNFNLYLRSLDGKEQQLNAFEEPVEAVWEYRGDEVDEELIGVYELDKQTRQWNYAGGQVLPDREGIQLKLDHAGSYSVFEYNKSFNDVPNTHWAYRPLKILAAKHIVKGITDESFEPRKITTRAEFTALLVRALGVQTVNADSSFNDVPANAWYAGEVAAAAQAGWIQGVSQDSFAPSEEITREQMAVLLVRAFESMSGKDIPLNSDLSGYADSSQVSEWAQTAVNKAISMGLMQGRAESLFDPGMAANRAETSQSIFNFLKMN